MSKVCILHYHLNPGGVTRIIESQVKCLKEQDSEIEILVMTGQCDNPELLESLGAELVIEGILNYLPADAANLNFQLEQIQKLLSRHINSGDIIHFHNMNL